MKSTQILLTGVATLLLASCGESFDTKANPKTSEDSFSYAVGVSVGQTLKRQGLDKLAYGSFVRGIQEGLAKDSGFILSNEKMEAVRKNYITSLQNKRMKTLQEDTKKMLEGISKEKGVSLLPSKGYYKVGKVGSGPTPQSYDTVECRYVFKTGKGEVLVDNTKDPVPFRGPLKSLNLPPLEEAFMKTSAGGTFTLYVSNEMNPVLARSARNFDESFGVSIFEVQLISVKAGLPEKAATK